MIFMYCLILLQFSIRKASLVNVIICLLCSDKVWSIVITLSDIYDSIKWRLSWHQHILNRKHFPVIFLLQIKHIFKSQHSHQLIRSKLMATIMSCNKLVFRWLAIKFVPNKCSAGTIKSMIAWTEVIFHRRRKCKWAPSIHKLFQIRIG